MSLLNILIRTAFINETQQNLLAAFAPERQFMASHQTITGNAFYIHLLTQEINNTFPRRMMILEALLAQLLIFFQRGHVSSAISNNDKEDAIIYLLNYLHHNYANEDLSIDYLAQKFNIQKRMLERKILSIIALTPGDYLTHVRLCHAMNLLVASQRSITDIAYRCGFSDSNYFSHRFKRFFDMAPRSGSPGGRSSMAIKSVIATVTQLLPRPHSAPA